MINRPPLGRGHRDDLVALLAEHYPTKFPLIDYERQNAYAACTRALTSPTAATPWPCELFIAARDVG